MSFKDKLRLELLDYAIGAGADKYLNKPSKNLDQAIASIVELVDKDIIGEYEDEVIYDSESAEDTNDYDAEVRNMFRYKQSAKLTQEDTE